jgi:hypothetical protein
MLLQGCSGAYHLRQAVKKGIVVKSDTVYTDVITPGSISEVHDTIPEFLDRVKIDTFKTETTKWKLKLKYDTITNEVFTQVQCLPDTIRVPTYVNNEFQDVIQKSKWYQWVVVGIGLLLVLVIVVKIWK